MVKIGLKLQIGLNSNNKILWGFLKLKSPIFLNYFIEVNKNENIF